MRSVLITGTSTGIGLATAATLAARRWRVFATMRNLEKRGLLEQAAQEASVPDNIEIGQLDVTDAASNSICSCLHPVANRQQARLLSDLKGEARIPRRLLERQGQIDETD